MKDPIAMDAAVVAYFPNFRAIPKIMRVERHTATQVIIEGGRRFTRERGRAVGGSRFDDAYIENVEQRHHERIAASELHAGADVVWKKVWQLQEMKHAREREALQKLAQGRMGYTVAEVKEAIARLAEFAQHNFGVTIEVDVPVEKKA